MSPVVAELLKRKLAKEGMRRIQDRLSSSGENAKPNSQDRRIQAANYMNQADYIDQAEALLGVRRERKA